MADRKVIEVINNASHMLLYTIFELKGKKYVLATSCQTHKRRNESTVSSINTSTLYDYEDGHRVGMIVYFFKSHSTREEAESDHRRMAKMDDEETLELFERI